MNKYWPHIQLADDILQLIKEIGLANYTFLVKPKSRLLTVCTSLNIEDMLMFQIGTLIFRWVCCNSVHANHLQWWCVCKICVDINHLQWQKGWAIIFSKWFKKKNKWWHFAIYNVFFSLDIFYDKRLLKIMPCTFE